MAVTSIGKVSGVISIHKIGTPIKYYYGNTGSFVTNLAATGYAVKIDGDTYQINLADLRVNGQEPTSIENGFVLLNAVFGT